MNQIDQIREEIKEAFKLVKFEETNHIYTVNDNELTSTSYKSKSFANEFKANKMAELVAKKHNKHNDEKRDKEYYLKEWKEKGISAREKGKRVHKYAQEYTPDLLPEIDEEFAIKEWFNFKPNHWEVVIQEIPLYSERFNYAGTPDMILYNTITKNLIISDWKTGKDLYKQYENQKLKYPFDYLADNAFNKYSIQQSHYKIMIEEKTNYRVEQMNLVWLNGKEYKNFTALDLSDKLITYYDGQSNLL